VSPLVRALVEEVKADPAALRELADALSAYVTLPAAPPDDGWLDLKRAAGYVGISPNALHKHTGPRTVPFAQDCPGGKCWFKRSELDAWRRGEWRP
jgi:hypothetical protein